MKKTSRVFRGFASIFLALLIIVQIVGAVANNWAGRVNELLGISASTIERSSDPADYTFLSDFENASALIDAEIALNTRLAAEGSVVLKGTPALGGTKVTLFGMRSGEKMQFGGSMGELTDASNVVTLAQAMEANGFSVNPTMVQFYKDMAKTYAPTRSSSGNVVSSYDGQGAAVGEVPVSEYEEYLDMSDEEYRTALEAKRGEITDFILEQCRTKRSNLYITDPVADCVAQQFEVCRLCDRDRNNGVGKRFVAELMAQLLQEGRLVTAETDYGEGIRTATAKELGARRQPAEQEQVEGQITMTF